MATCLMGLLVVFQGCQRVQEFSPRMPFPAHPPVVSNSADERYLALNLYHDVWQRVFNDYLDPSFNGQNWYRWKDRYDKVILTREDAYTAIETMLASLSDNYTRFLSPKDAADQNMHIDSKLSGIGVQIAPKDGELVVLTALEDSPAQRVGIMPLDKIIAIDRQPTKQLSVEEAVEKIRGPKGTTVSLTVVRKGESRLFKIVRDEVLIKTVFGKPISPDIGYIRLASFISQDMVKEMRAKLKSQMNTKAMILDLRGNSGGLLPNAVEISQMFLSDGKVVSIVDRHGIKEAYESDHHPLYKHPLVVLIDGGSASASEIFSGAMKDNHRATLVGTQTFGKGVVQKINYLQDWSELNLTVSKYYTPSGHDIDKKGISPDITVTLTDTDLKNNTDPQKQAAIDFLKRALLAKAS